MRVFLDTEFYENGPNAPVELISIGLVREDGSSYYAEAAEVRPDRWSSWLQQNVLPHLNGVRTPRGGIAEEVKDFMGERPEVWAYCGAYDWVVLCQLFGSMEGRPLGFPHHCNELRMMVEASRFPKRLNPRRRGAKHHALMDAWWAKDLYEAVKSFREEKAPETRGEAENEARAG